MNGIPISLIHPAISLSGYIFLALIAISGKFKAHQAHQGIILVVLLATSTVVLGTLKLLAHAVVVSHRGRVARHNDLGACLPGKGFLDDVGELIVVDSD